VPNHSRLIVFARVVLLPLVLVMATVAGLGSYYETSDDTTLAWLFSGVLAQPPVSALPLYFHGYGHGLAAAYVAWPGVPWVGALLGALLGAATVLTFAVLDRLLRPHLGSGALVLALATFFAGAWLEHWLWFSHVRVGVLLAGAALLFAAQRPGHRGALVVGLAGLGAAWLLRPGLAWVGYGAALPAAWLLAGSWRRARPVVLSTALGLGLLAGGAALLQAPAAARTQARDQAFARVLDFDQVRPQPRTAADSLGTAALDLWLMGDSTVVNAAFSRRAYRFVAADFWGRVVPAKLRLRAELLVRDYFLLLAALVATGVAASRRRGRQPWFWSVQVGFAAALIVLTGWLKLPPRLELPILDFWLLANLGFLLPDAAGSYQAGRPSYTGLIAKKSPGDQPAKPAASWRLGATAALLVLLLYGAKTWHRRQVLGQERRRHERVWAEISRRTGGHVRVLAGANDALKSLSPWQVCTPGPGPVLMLSGWQSHDQSQQELCRALTGAADQPSCLRRLAEPARGTFWLFSRETAQWLNRRFRYHAGTGPAVVLQPAAHLVADTTLRFYQPVAR